MIIVLRPVARFHYQQHNIGFRDCVAGRAGHAAVNGAIGTQMQAGCIHIYKLCIRGSMNAKNSAARGLWLSGDDADFGSHQSVDERGLAHVWPSRQGDKTTAKTGFRHSATTRAHAAQLFVQQHGGCRPYPGRGCLVPSPDSSPEIPADGLAHSPTPNCTVAEVSHVPAVFLAT